MSIRNNLALGQAIREMRLQANLTQSALGDKARIRQRTVSDIERGKGGRTETLFAILAALGMDITLASRQSAPYNPGNY